MEDQRPRYVHIYEKWPFLYLKGNDIWGKFDHMVCKGEMTFEELVDWVKSIEPECGECNEYQCICVKQAPIMENDGEQEWISNKEKVNVH